MAPNPVQVNENEYESSLSMASLIGFLLAVALGTLGAVVLLPRWVPGLAQSLIGSDPKAYWYLSRGSAFAALSLLWISMSLGLLITNKIARTWPGAPAAFALHEYVSLLGLAFAIFHALVLMGDHYINFNLAELLVPFAATNYHPNWVGLGQVGFYVWVILAGSFYVRPYITQKVWRVLHFASFATFLVALFHGLTSGTDSSLPWAQSYYWFIGGSLIFLLIYRIVSTLFPEKKPIPPAPPPAAPQQQRPVTSPVQAPNPPTVPKTEAVISRRRVILHPASETSADAARPSLPALQEETQPQRAASTSVVPTEIARPSPSVAPQQKSRLATLLQGDVAGSSQPAVMQKSSRTLNTLAPGEVTALPHPTALQQPRQVQAAMMSNETASSPRPAVLQKQSSVATSQLQQSGPVASPQPNPVAQPQQPRQQVPTTMIPNDQAISSSYQGAAQKLPNLVQAATSSTDVEMPSRPVVWPESNPVARPQQPTPTTATATDAAVVSHLEIPQKPSQDVVQPQQIHLTQTQVGPTGADVVAHPAPVASPQVLPVEQPQTSFRPVNATASKTDEAELSRSVVSQQKLSLATLLQDAVLPPRPVAPQRPLNSVVSQDDPPTPPIVTQNNIPK